MPAHMAKAAHVGAARPSEKAFEAGQLDVAPNIKFRRKVQNYTAPDEIGVAMSGARHRRKGDRIERAMVPVHIDLLIHTERVPLPGALRYQDNGADVDVYAFGRDEAPLVTEVKSRKSGDGFRQLEKWLSDSDALFLRRNSADSHVVVPWRTCSALPLRLRR